MAFRENITELVNANSFGLTAIHNSWERVSLSHIGTVTNGYAFKSKFFNNEGVGLPIIRIRDVLKGRTSTYYSGEVPEGYLVVNDDLLIGMDGDFNTCKWSSGSALLNQRVCKIDITSSKLYDRQFLFYALPGYLELINEHTSATTVKHLSSKTLEELPVPLPPLNEQNRIANKLDSLLAKVDASQQHLEKIPTILKRFRQSVLAAATSGELTKEWRSEQKEPLENYSKEHEITEYDDQTLEQLPTSWNFIPFYKAADIESNLVDPKLTPEAIHIAPNHLESNTGRIIKRVTVQDDGVKSAKHKFYQGQIIYSKIRPYLNKVCFADVEGVCSADMYPIKANIETKYLLYYMLSEKFVYWATQQQGRVVLPKINQKALNKIPVPTPSIREQQEIVRRVESLFAKADEVEKLYFDAKKRVDRLTQSILAKAFRGELVPQDTNDEPAAELLKHIQSEREQQAKNSAKPKRKPKAKPKEKTFTVNVVESIPEVEAVFTTLIDKSETSMKLEELPDNYLQTLLTDFDGQTQAGNLWKRSNLSIDDFYAKLKKEMQTGKIIDDKSSFNDPELRVLKLAI